MACAQMRKPPQAATGPRVPSGHSSAAAMTALLMGSGEPTGDVLPPVKEAEHRRVLPTGRDRRCRLGASDAARYHLPQRARANGAGGRLRLPSSVRWPCACRLRSRLVSLTSPFVDDVDYQDVPGLSTTLAE
jgi:hypothetical protein